MRSFLLVWMFVVHLMASGAAQDLTPSISWRKPNITSSKDDRINIASAAIEKASTMLQSSWFFNDSLHVTEFRIYAQMAEIDRLTSQTRYRQTLKQCFALAESYESSMNLLNYRLEYGYAAVRAYAAYQDQDFLDRAVTSWTFARKYTISQEQAALGTINVKRFNIPSSCNGATMAGGTFYNTDANNTDIFGLSSSFFLVVSALLAEVTYNQTYLDAAIESASFIQSHLLNPSSNIAWYSMSTNGTCSLQLGDVSYDSGIFIEGLAVLANITRNVSTEALLRSTVVAVVTNTQWQGLDGIINSSASFPAGYYIVRALVTLYERNTTLSDLREYTKEYIGVQYNAVIDLATSGGSNVYGLWTGPSSTSFSSDNQTIAISALLSAIQLIEDQPSSKSSVNSTSTVFLRSTDQYSFPTRDSSTAPIVSGVVLGVTVIGVGAVLLYKRLRRRKNESHFAVDDSSPRVITPFMETSIPVSPEISGGHINQAKRARYPLAENRGGSSSLPGVGTRGTDVHNESTPSLRVPAIPPNAQHSDGVEGIPTDDLLRLLNERLQSGRWNGVHDEVPPAYREGQAV